MFGRSKPPASPADAKAKAKPGAKPSPAGKLPSASQGGGSKGAGSKGTASKPAPSKQAAPKPVPASGPPPKLTAGQAAYEERRAREAGVSLETWLARKRKASVAATPSPARPKDKPKGFFTRLLDKAHKPL